MHETDNFIATKPNTCRLTATYKVLAKYQVDNDHTQFIRFTYNCLYRYLVTIPWIVALTRSPKY